MELNQDFNLLFLFNFAFLISFKFFELFKTFYFVDFDLCLIDFLIFDTILDIRNVQIRTFGDDRRRSTTVGHRKSLSANVRDHSETFGVVRNRSENLQKRSEWFGEHFKTFGIVRGAF